MPYLERTWQARNGNDVIILRHITDLIHAFLILKVFTWNAKSVTWISLMVMAMLKVDDSLIFKNY